MSEEVEINVAHLARLARLSLDAQALQTAHQDLQNIMQMVNHMQSVDTEGVEPMAHPLDATQRLRADQVTEAVDADHFQAHAPATRDNFYLVPQVIESAR